MCQHFYFFYGLYHTVWQYSLSINTAHKVGICLWEIYFWNSIIYFKVCLNMSIMFRFTSGTGLLSNSLDLVIEQWRISSLSQSPDIHFPRYIWLKDPTAWRFLTFHVKQCPEVNSYAWIKKKKAKNFSIHSNNRAAGSSHGDINKTKLFSNTNELIFCFQRRRKDLIPKFLSFFYPFD